MISPCRLSITRVTIILDVDVYSTRRWLLPAGVCGRGVVSIRQFKRAGEQFVDALAAFTMTKLINHNNSAALIVISNTLA
jgi:hypothetical protein